jgi:hypothetical protein
MEEFLRAAFADNAGLPASLIFDNDLTLAEIISRSDRMHNSVDLIEAFARTANALEHEYGVRISLPMFSLDSRISAVIASILPDIERATAAPADAVLPRRG